MQRILDTLKIVFLAGIVLGGLLMYHMTQIEPFRLQSKTTAIDIKRITHKDPIRILHLADLHYIDARSLERIEKAIEMGQATNPDLICITGDFVTFEAENLAPLIHALRKLAGNTPAIACLGNHDGGRWAARHGSYTTTREIREMLYQCNILCLENDSMVLHLDNNLIECIGLSDCWAGTPRVAKAFSKLDHKSDGLRLLLSHNPDSRELVRGYNWDLMLCGHTHGGQLSLPVIGTPFAPIRDHTYVTGLHEWDNHLIHTTHGIGNVYGLRFNCPPAIDLLEVF